MEGRGAGMTTETERPHPAGKVVVGLVQINNSFSGQNYLPYAVGLLETYVRSAAVDPDRYVFLPSVYKRARIADVCAHLEGADVVGFSSYVWNARISLEAARRLKLRRPNVVVVFGGPQVPDDAESFLRAHPYIDVAVHNEGERTFLELLEAYPHINPAAVKGVSYIDDAGVYVRTEPQPRFRDLSCVPSPYLSGAFERLMTDHPEETWIGLWETNRGCPFQCTFCDWGSATAAKVNQFDLGRLTAEVDWFADKKIEYVFCCDANFGILKRDVDIAAYVAEKKGETGFPKALSVQNTKNATERAYQAQSILAAAGLNKGVAISMQSIDEKTLKLIKRDNISLQSFFELQRRFTKDKIETYSDLIIGLPGETYDTFVDGVDMLMESGQHNRIQFNNLSILPNAEMGNPDYQRRYGMQLIQSEIINIHGELVERDDDVAELQDLVTATAAMPAVDWRRVRAFCWMAALLHFDKLLQIPIIIAHEISGKSYRSIIELFTEVDSDNFPLLGSIQKFFIDYAENIQNGGAEYVHSADWLNIYWPADEYVFIELTVDGKIDQFYDEAFRIIAEALADSGGEALESAVRDAVRLNRSMLKSPNADGDLTVPLQWNVLEVYNAALQGDKIPLRPTSDLVHVGRTAESWEDLNDWCRRVVWWGNKKGAYLYNGAAVVPQPAGHY